MERKKELEKVKKIIKKYYNEGGCGLFSSRNLVGDPMITIFNGEYFTVDICYYYSYFEVFGTTENEFNELGKFYDNLLKL